MDRNGGNAGKTNQEAGHAEGSGSGERAGLEARLKTWNVAGKGKAVRAKLDLMMV